MSATSSEFSGKTAIITGSSAGIGQEIALQLANKGANVVITGRNNDRLEETLKILEQASGGKSERFLSCPGDVADSSYRNSLIEQTISKFGQLDMLVCNAGTTNADDGVMTLTEEIWDNICDTNLKSIFFLVQKSIPYLEKTKGCVVNMSSILGSIPGARICYNSMKAGLDHMTRCMALELAPKGIRVNAVAPSFIPDTQLVVRRMKPGDSQEPLQAFCSTEQKLQPMGQLGSKQQISEVTCFLLSNQANFITGQILSASGGREFMGPLPAKSN